jgi:hypothetical protein
MRRRGKLSGRLGINPKVFISHAGKDKGCFVEGFATRLRQEAGVDAWVDLWEMAPGDNLVDKIFEEGLGEADTVIAVVSRHSLKSRWVKEELSTAKVLQVEGRCRLIPVIIDEVEDQLPVMLKSTLWQRIGDLDDYEEEFRRIRDSIYNRRERPALGTPPGYVRAITDTLPGLSPIDTLVLRLSCESVIENEYYGVYTPDVWEQIQVLEVSLPEFNDSLEVLHEAGYLRIDLETVGSADASPSEYDVLLDGFEEYAKAEVEEYGGVKDAVGYYVLNHIEEVDHHLTSDEIADALDQPRMIVKHLLKVFARDDLVQALEAGGGAMWVLSASVRLRRALGD